MEDGKTAVADPAGQPSTDPTATAPEPAVTPSGAPETPPATGTTAGQPSKEPELYEVVVAGKKEILTRAEVLERASKGSDYTRKMQQVSEERKRLQQQYQSDLQRALANERERIQREALEPPDPNQVTQSKIAQIEARIEDDKLDRQIQSIKSQFPNVNEKMLMLEALDRYGKDLSMEHLNEVAAEMNERVSSEREGVLDSYLKDEKHPKISAFRQSVIDSYLKAKSAEGKPKGETGSTGTPGGAGQRPRPKSLDEGDVRAKAMLDELERGSR